MRALADDRVSRGGSPSVRAPELIACWGAHAPLDPAVQLFPSRNPEACSIIVPLWKSSVNNAMIVLRYNWENGDERLYLPCLCLDWDGGIIACAGSGQEEDPGDESSGMEGL